MTSVFDDKNVTRLLHVSDTHLGYIAYGQTERAEDFERAFRETIQIAIDRDVDSVIHTGDLTHDSDREAGLSDGAITALRDLEDAGIPFYFVLGNHDISPNGEPQSWADSLENLGLGTRLGSKPSLCDGLSLYGVDYHPEEWWNEPDLSFDLPVPNTVPVLCMHQSVAPLVDNKYAETALERVQTDSAVDFDLALLGHSHYTTTHEDAPLVARYAGATERTTRGYHDEAAVVTELAVSDDEIDYREHELDTRPFSVFSAAYPEGTDSAEMRTDLTEFDVTGEIVTVYTSEATDRDAVERAFESAGAFDARAWTWNDETPVPSGVSAGSPDSLESASSETADHGDAEPVRETESENDTAHADRESTEGATTSSDRADPASIVHLGSVGFSRDSVSGRDGDIERAFEDVITTALDRAVDAVVLTGDLFAANPSSEAVAACRDQLSRLQAADIPFLVESGDGPDADALDSLRSDGLVTVLSAAGVTAGELSVHGGAAGADFAQDVLQVTPSTDARFGVVASTARISPPAPIDNVDWNYTQIEDLLGPQVDALLLGSGEQQYTTADDRLLGNSPDLVPELDKSCLDGSRHPGRYTVLSFESPGSFDVETCEVDAPPLITQDITVEGSTTYDELRRRFADLDIDGAHVRARIRGVDTALRTRIARHLQRDAKSVVVWGGEDGPITEAGEARAPGTDRWAVAREQDPDPTIPVTESTEESVEADRSEGPAAGRSLVEEGYARIETREGDGCGFVLDVHAWEDAHGDRSSHVDRQPLYYGEWYCPHDATDDSDTCIFHTPSDETDGQTERRRFFETVANAEERTDLQFYGASLTNLIASGHELDSLEWYPIDIQHATVGHIRLENTVLDQPLRLDHANVGETVIVDGSRLDAPLKMNGAAVHGPLKIRFSTCTAQPRFANATFGDSVGFRQTDFEEGAVLSRAAFDESVRFFNCLVSGHTTFYDTTFDRSLEIKRTNFRLECRFEGATFNDEVHVVQSRFDQALGLEDTTASDDVDIEQSTVNGVFDISNADHQSLTIADTSFQNAVQCFRTTVGALTIRHTVVDGQTRFNEAEFGRVRFDDVTFFDHVELVGDNPGADPSPYTVHDAFVVTNGIFHRPLEIVDAGLGGECRFEESVFHDAVSMDSVTCEAALVFTDSSVDGNVELDGVLQSDLVLRGASFTGTVSADGIDSVGGPLTAAHASFAGPLDFGDVSFDERIDFEGATVDAPAQFDEVKCSKSAIFEYTAFRGQVAFTDARFEDTVSFSGAEFEREAAFTGIDVSTGVDGRFDGAQFRSVARFTDADFGGETDFEQARFRSPVRFIGAVFRDEAAFSDAAFQDATRFLHVTFENGIDAVDADFHGTTRFDDVRLGGDACFSQALFEHSVTLTNLSASADAAVDFGEARFAKDVTFTDADLDGRLSFERATFTASATFDRSTGSGEWVLSRANFGEDISFENVDLEDGLAFDRVTVTRSADFTDATIGGREITFDATRFEGPVTFAGVETTAPVSMVETAFQDRSTFDTAVFGGSATFVDATFEKQSSFDESRFGAAATFDDAVFRNVAQFEETVFEESASFRGVEVTTPRFRGTRCDRGAIDCREATVGDGTIVQPPNERTLYDFTEAEIGDVRFRGADGGSVDFSLFRLVKTRFDGFVFAEHDGLKAADWTLETYDSDAETPGAEALETTYLNAKNGAAMVGDSEAEGAFFVRELEHRGATHREAGRRRERLGNRTLSLIANYGQSPNRVFWASVGTVFGFGGLFHVLRAALADFPDGADSVYHHFFGPMLLSLESFTTLVFGGVSVTSFWVRAAGAVEGFIGAFFIALFLYALTQSIDR